MTELVLDLDITKIHARPVNGDAGAVPLRSQEETMRELDYIAKQFALGRISRREFIGRAIAVGASMPLATTLMTNVLHAATPRKGGEMTFAMSQGSTTDTLEPGTMANGYLWVLSYAVRGSLTEIAPGGHLVPGLFESWEPSADAKRWVFKLRSGVAFHSGKALTPDDVLASINYHRGADSRSSLKPTVAQIESISIDGDNLVFTLKGGNADFPFIFASADFSVCPSDGEGNIDWQSGDGAGGYVLKAYEPGVRANLERNPTFWNPDRAHADSVEFLSIIDSAAQVNALLTGEVDAIDGPDVKVIDRIAGIEGIIVDETTGPKHFTFPMRTDTPPFNDRNVRLAIKHAIDRDEMLAKILRGHGTVGNDTPIGPTFRYHAEDLKPFPYDPDKARWHLKQSGFDSLTVDLSTADAAFKGAVDAAVIYKEQARKAGIEINVVRQPNDGYWSDVWTQKPWCAAYWGGWPTEDEMFTLGYSSGASWNDTYWENDRFNNLLIQARPEIDTAKRRDIYVEMQHILRDDGGAVIPMFSNFMMGRRSRVTHGELGNDRGFDGYRMIERWWVA